MPYRKKKSELLQRIHSRVHLGIVKRQHSALFHLFTEGENVLSPLTGLAAVCAHHGYSQQSSHSGT